MPRWLAWPLNTVVCVLRCQCLNKPPRNFLRWHCHVEWSAAVPGIKSHSISRKQWGVACVTSLGVGAKPDIRGIRAKAHAKIAMRMVYAFSRIAKQPAYMCKPYITSCMTISAACHRLQLQGAHTDRDAPRSARSISSLVCPCQDLGS